MLFTVRAEETPELVRQASELVERVEVEEAQSMEGDIHQVIRHVHGITPANRPLGWRELILEGEDLLHLEWISQLRQLWPFESQDARVVLCTMATGDLRDAERIRFHFVIDYEVSEGRPKAQTNFGRSLSWRVQCRKTSSRHRPHTHSGLVLRSAKM